MRNILELREQLITEAVLEGGWWTPQENVYHNLALPRASYNKTGVHLAPSAVFGSCILLTKEGLTVAWHVGGAQDELQHCLVFPDLQSKAQESPVSAFIPWDTWSPSPWGISLAWADTHCPQSQMCPSQILIQFNLITWQGIN